MVTVMLTVMVVMVVMAMVIIIITIIIIALIMTIKIIVIIIIIIIIITVTMEAVWTGWKRRHFCHLTLRSIHHMRISFYLSYFFIHFISLCFFICRLSLFSIHPRIFHPPYAPFFYFSIATGPLLSISYILSPHYEPVFCYPSIILPLYKTLFYLSHRFEIFGQWKFPSIFSLRLLFPWEGNDASNFL